MKASLANLNAIINSWSIERQDRALGNILKVAHVKLQGFTIDGADFVDVEDEDLNDAVIFLESMWLARQEANKVGHQ